MTGPHDGIYTTCRDATSERLPNDVLCDQRPGDGDLNQHGADSEKETRHRARKRTDCVRSQPFLRPRALHRRRGIHSPAYTAAVAGNTTKIPASNLATAATPARAQRLVAHGH